MFVHPFSLLIISYTSIFTAKWKKSISVYTIKKLAQQAWKIAQSLSARLFCSYAPSWGAWWAPFWGRQYNGRIMCGWQPRIDYNPTLRAIFGVVSPYSKPNRTPPNINTAKYDLCHLWLFEHGATCLTFSDFIIQHSPFPFHGWEQEQEIIE